MNRRLAHAFLAALIVFCSGALAHAQPLKVFILCGQSNMQGHADIRTMKVIGMDEKTAPLLKEMQNADGAPVVLDDVVGGRGLHLSVDGGLQGSAGLRIQFFLISQLFFQQLLQIRPCLGIRFFVVCNRFVDERNGVIQFKLGRQDVTAGGDTIVQAQALEAGIDGDLAFSANKRF